MAVENAYIRVILDLPTPATIKASGATLGGGRLISSTTCTFRSRRGMSPENTVTGPPLAQLATLPGRTVEGRAN